MDKDYEAYLKRKKETLDGELNYARSNYQRPHDELFDARLYILLLDALIDARKRIAELESMVKKP